MAQPADELTLLYPLRHPFTSLTIKEVEGFVDIAVDVLGEYSGTLRIYTATLPEVLLQAFANGSRPIGVRSAFGVEWYIDILQFPLEQVIDQFGELHNIRDLKEELV